MIFKATCQQVLDGTKTQTRRPVKPGETAWWPLGEYYINSVTDRNCRLKWELGRSYAVQPGRGKKSVGRIRILKIRRERLWDIQDEDIRAEGVLTENTLDTTIWGDFMALWAEIYKKKPYRWEDNPEVWVLEFERVEGPGTE